MAFNEQSQPKVEASFRTHNLGSPTNQQQKEEEEEQTFIPPPNDYPSSIGAIVAVNEPHNANINTKKIKYQCDSYPEGYRFAPHDYELIVHYLKKKLLNQPLPHDKIREVNLYKHNPDYFTAKYQVLGERDWYFFTPRDRKYLKGSRPSRKAGDGYWKATGADKPIKMDGDPVGYKKSLVFYLGKPPKGDKTDWIMHEFRVDTHRRERENANDMRLDDWVLCRVYKKSKKSKKAKQQNQPEQNKYSVAAAAAAALSEERAPPPPPCVNDNGIADMNCDYNSSMGDSNQFINSYSDWFRFPPPKEAILDFSGCLPNMFGVHDHPTTSHIQSTFQNEFLQTPQFSDCCDCLQNFSVPPHHPTSSFNYGTTMTIGMEEEHGLEYSRTREPPQDDDWNMWKLDKNLASQDLSFPC